MAAELSRDDYRRQLFDLLPPGRLWARDPDSRLQRLLAGLGQELHRVDTRAQALLIEADPRQTLELFEEWEASYGLPSRCAPLEQSMADRRAALLGRLLGRGGMRFEDYRDLAAGLGYDDIEIIEHRESTVEMLDSMGPRGAEIGDDMNEEPWNFAWDVLIPWGVMRVAVVDEAEIGDPLRTWGDELVECALHEAAPAWGYLNVGYLDVEVED